MSDADRPTLLVVGARQGSLGAAVAVEAREYPFAEIVTAGIIDEPIKMDINNRAQVHERLVNIRPDYIVCTVGINEPASIGDRGLDLRMYDAFRVNCLGPLAILQEFATSPVRPQRRGYTKRFVAVSSNSARIPRTHSMAYCASKAALSMALRVAAREMASGHWDEAVQIWGYEPGLLAGTPMTRATEAAFSGQVGPDPGQFRMHRMKGVEYDGIPVGDLASKIVTDLANYSPAMNGLMIPFDADEL